MSDVTDKVERAIARFERVTRQLDERGGPAQEAARRERQRLNQGLGRAAGRLAIGFVAVWTIVLVVGLVKPIGMMGFLIPEELLMANVAYGRPSGAVPIDSVTMFRFRLSAVADIILPFLSCPDRLLPY